MGNDTWEVPRGFTGNLTFTAVAIGSTASELSIASTVGTGYDYSIKGVMYHGADDASTASVPAALPVQAADTQCIYLLLNGVTDALSVIKGDEYLTTDIDNGAETLQYPEPADNLCPIAAIKVITVAVTFTAGTTDFDASGVTSTYTDLCGLPEGPIA